MFTLKVKIPEAGKTSVLVDGIGEVKNGGDLQISAELAETFAVTHGATVMEAFKDHPYITVVKDAPKPQEDKKDGKDK